VRAVAPRPGRRALLLGCLGAVAGLAGCTSDGGAKGGPPRHVPTPDELAAGRAVLSARALITELTALAVASPALAPVLTPLTADHTAHLAALGTPAASPSPSGTGAPPSPTASATASGPAPTPAHLVASVLAAATQALQDVTGTTPATAGLLGRIAAARFVHADLVAAAARLAAPPEPAPSPPAAPSTGASPSGPSASSPSTPAATAGPSSATGPTLAPATASALSRLLAGEHAAVFAYGLVTARAPRGRVERARALWQAHRARRDELEARLSAAGVDVPASEPAYDAGQPPTTADQVVALAAKVEDGLAAVAFAAVTATSGSARAEVALDLVRAARRSAAWTGESTALPG